MGNVRTGSVSTSDAADGAGSRVVSMPNDILPSFEIHFRRSSDDRSIPVTVRVPDADQLVEGLLQLPFDADAITEYFAELTEGATPAEAAAAIGAQLFEALFQGPIKDLYLATRTRLGQAFRYRLLIEAPAAARMPWELLCDPQRGKFLALENPLVRSFSLTEPARPLQVQPPLRILVGAASPADLPSIAGQDEIDQILRELGELVQRKEAVVTPLLHITLRSLQDTLREAEQQGQPFHILHLIAHGARDPSTDRTLLYLENDQGGIEPVDPVELVEVLRPFDLKLIYLNACESAALSAFDLTQGFAPALLAIGVPAVIGMQVAVWNRVARQIAQDFYAALADNQPVDQALLSARQLARAEALVAAGIAIPVCFLRTASGKIVDLARPAKPPLTRATWRPWLQAQTWPKKLAQALVWLIGLVSALLGIYWGVKAFAPETQPTPVPPMIGDYNIAVAAFTTWDEAGYPVRNVYGQGLARQVAEQLQTTIQTMQDAGFTIGLYGPDQTGIVEGNNDEERAASAQKRAADLNADLLLYGQLVMQADGTSLQPRAFISNERLRYAEDLAGDYAFGALLQTEESITVNSVASKSLHEQLAQRAGSLAQFVVALSYFRNNNQPEAAKWFNQMLRSADSDARLQRTALLFLGSVAARQNDLPAALATYRQALQVDPRYARAQLGRVQVEFLQAKDGCQPGKLDPQAVEAVVAGYQRALQMNGEPGDEIGAKVNALLGDVYLCQSLATRDDPAAQELRALAQEAYQAVIQRYDETGSLGIQYLAAAAWQGMGGVALAAADRLDSDSLAVTQAPFLAQLKEAETAFQHAIKLSRSPSASAISQLNLALIHTLRHECVAAQEALDAATSNHKQADATLSADNAGYESLRAEIEKHRIANCPPQ